MATSYTYIDWNGKYGPTFGYLKSAKKKAQEVADRTGHSVVIYPNGKGKTHHVYPKKRTAAVTNPRSLSTRFIPAKFKTRSGIVSGEVRRNPKNGRVQIRVNPRVAGKLAGYANPVLGR